MSSSFSFPNHNQMLGPRRHLYSSFYLAAAVPVALIVWLLRKLTFSVRALKDLRHRACRIPRLLDQTKLAGVTTALHGAITDGICTIPSLWPPPQDDSGGESDDEPDHQHLRYPPIQSLVKGVPGTSLFVSWFARLLRGLRRRVFRDASEDKALYRLSDVHQNPWILHTVAENCTGLYDLTNESRDTCIMKLIITTTLVIIIWQELHQQNLQSCEELKKSFAEVAGESIEKLLAVASSFSDPSRSNGHILRLLTVYEALVDVLFNIEKLSLNISGEIVRIFNKMVNAFKGVIQQAANDIHNCTESTIHPTTVVFVRVLEFFCRNRDMVQNISETDPCSDMFYYWVPKLDKGAEKKFQEKGRRCLFVLNNIYYVLQMKCHAGLLPNAASDPLIQKYIVSYLDEYWSPPVVSYLNVEPMMIRRSSLDKFMEKFKSIYDRQMTWKVQTELKKILREKIVVLIGPEYKKFLEALQANPRPKGVRRRSEKWNYSVEQLVQAIRELFER